jgi:LacI family repressor for deo operon, udp, cdd, tsx, nupC, and nupG
VVAQGAAAARWAVKALQIGTDAHTPVNEVNLHPARLVLRGSTGPAPADAVPAG